MKKTISIALILTLFYIWITIPLSRTLAMDAVYQGTNYFYATGDQTDHFLAGRAVWASDESIGYGWVEEATYDQVQNFTYVKLGPGSDSLTSGLTEVKWSPMEPRSAPAWSTWFLTSGRTNWDPGNLVDGAQESKDFTVTGARTGDFAIASMVGDIQDLGVSAMVTANDTVTVTILNETGGAVDLPIASWEQVIFKSRNY